MGTITKIKSVSLTKMNNAEYVNYMTRARTLIAASGEEEENPDENPDILSVSVGPNPLGISEQQLNDFDADLALMVDLVNQSRTSDETAQMLDVDKQRDDLVVYLTSSISQMTKSPVSAQKTAAQSLYNVIKPYIGIYRSANQQETQQIEGLLTDVNKPENAPKIETLGLKPVIDELSAANKQYTALTAERTNNKAANIKDNSTIVRQRMDSLYDDMTTLAFVQSVAAPTDKTAVFITNLNALIDETSALYNQRIAAAKKKKPSDENPDPLV